jgi:hypothetical protein
VEANEALRVLRALKGLGYLPAALLFGFYGEKMLAVVNSSIYTCFPESEELSPYHAC